MLAELRQLLLACPQAATADEYRTAIIDRNLLGKATESTRRRTYRYLRELYELDPRRTLFRALRDLWHHDDTAQPLLAILCACARDPVLRATATCVLDTSEGDDITSHDLSLAVESCYPDAYNDSSAGKIGRNTASSWTQSGHLAGRVRKVRSRAVCRPSAVAYTLLLGHLQGYRGEALFQTLWARILDEPLATLHEHAAAASQRGWIEFRRGGGVVDVGFRLLLRPPEEGSA